MSSSYLRLRRQGLNLSQAALAKLAGTSQAQIDRLEKGDRALSKEWAERLAPLVGVTPQQLLFELEEPVASDVDTSGAFRPPPVLMNDRDRMPVYAATEGGDGHIIVSTDEIDRVPRPYTLEGIPEAYAILVNGDSMFPAYEPGDYAWVNPRLPPMRDTDCILYSLPDDGGDAKATIKRLVSFDTKAWKLRQWNPAKDFPLDRKIWNKHHRVVGNFRRR